MFKNIKQAINKAFNRNPTGDKGSGSLSSEIPEPGTSSNTASIPQGPKVFLVDKSEAVDFILKKPLDFHDLTEAEKKILLKQIAKINNTDKTPFIKEVKERITEGYKGAGIHLYKTKKGKIKEDEIASITKVENLFNLKKYPKFNNLYAYIVMMASLNKSQEDIKEFIASWLKRYEVGDLGIKEHISDDKKTEYAVLEQKAKVKLQFVKSIKGWTQQDFNADNIKAAYEGCRNKAKEMNLPFTNFYIKLLPQKKAGDPIPQGTIRLLPTFSDNAILAISLPTQAYPYCATSASTLTFKDFETLLKVFKSLRNMNNSENFMKTLSNFIMFEYGFLISA